MKLYIGSDHAGFELKEKLKKYLLQEHHEVVDCGCYSEERADYADYAHKVCRKHISRQKLIRYFTLWKWKWY